MMRWSSAPVRRWFTTAVAVVAAGCTSSTTDHLGFNRPQATGGAPAAAAGVGGQSTVASGAAGQTTGAGLTTVAGNAPVAGQSSTSTEPGPSRVITTLYDLPCPPSYPNPYRDVLGWSSSKINDQLGKAYQQLFHGDPENEAIYVEVGTDRAVIRDILHGSQARTEGVGLGMLISVMLNRQDEFDRLWHYARAELEKRSGPLAGYFGSFCDSLPADTSDNPKTEPCIDPYGFQQFVMALLLARQRFSVKSVDYERDAIHLFDVMRNKEFDQRQARLGGGGAGPGSTNSTRGGAANMPSGGTTGVPNNPAAGTANNAGEESVSNLFDDLTRLVYLDPTYKANRVTGTALEMPGYYTVWAQVTHDPYYEVAAQKARLFLAGVADDVTGLIPVRAPFEEKPSGTWSMFAPEAYRALLNLVIDRTWGTSSNWQVAQIDKMLQFFIKKAENGTPYGSAYSLDGSIQYIADHRTELVLVNGVIASLADELPYKDKTAYIDAASKVDIPTGNTRYYPGILYLMSNLILSGRFQLCWPQGT